MALSSGSITHFTKFKKNLAGILKETFKIKYCHETIYSKENDYHFLVPIVSFSDIPFSQIMNHINSYGSYGIGLSKRWAELNGLNPVLYLDKNSVVTTNLLNNTCKKLVGSIGEKRIDLMDDNERPIFDFIRYLKNYEGELKRADGKIIKNYRFSDEREWRYAISPKKPYTPFGQVGHHPDKRIKEAKNELNSTIVAERLRFKPDDITYIIIQNESERDYFINVIENAKIEFSDGQVKRLTSRILSVEQLKTDF